MQQTLDYVASTEIHNYEKKATAAELNNSSGPNQGEMIPPFNV